MAALGRQGLAVDEEGEYRGRRLEDVAGRDDEVGALAGFQRPDLVGDTQNLRRGERDGLERDVLGQAERDGRGRLVGEIPAIGRPGGASPRLELIATVTPAACSRAGLAYAAS